MHATLLYRVNEIKNTRQFRKKAQGKKKYARQFTKNAQREKKNRTKVPKKGNLEKTLSNPFLDFSTRMYFSQVRGNGNYYCSRFVL